MRQNTNRTVAEKMGIKEGVRTLIINAPEGVISSLEFPQLEIAQKLSGTFGYIHLFITSQKEMHQKFPKLREHLELTGSLWVSWPKSGKLNTDLNIKSVIQIGYDHGLVESKCLSVDQTWSALMFTHPKKGKTYNNSYGKLNDQSGQS